MSAADFKKPNHHLRRKSSGLFQLRFTVDRGPKYVGERVIMSLRTKDENEARQRREIVGEAMSKAQIINGWKILDIEFTAGTTTKI